MFRSLTSISSLDEPLHLRILTSIASSIAKSSALPSTSPSNGNDRSLSEPDIGVLLKGLPRDSVESRADPEAINDVDHEDSPEWVNNCPELHP